MKKCILRCLLIVSIMNLMIGCGNKTEIDTIPTRKTPELTLSTSVQNNFPTQYGGSSTYLNITYPDKTEYLPADTVIIDELGNMKEYIDNIFIRTVKYNRGTTKIEHCTYDIFKIQYDTGEIIDTIDYDEALEGMVSDMSSWDGVSNVTVIEKHNVAINGSKAYSVHTTYDYTWNGQVVKTHVLTIMVYQTGDLWIISSIYSNNDSEGELIAKKIISSIEIKRKI